MINLKNLINLDQSTQQLDAQTMKTVLTTILAGICYFSAPQARALHDYIPRISLHLPEPRYTQTETKKVLGNVYEVPQIVDR